jgi:hypothetical protein
MLNKFYALKLSLQLISNYYRILNHLFYLLLLPLLILLAFFRIHTIKEEHNVAKNINTEFMNDLLTNQVLFLDQICW